MSVKGFDLKARGRVALVTVEAQYGLVLLRGTASRKTVRSRSQRESGVKVNGQVQWAEGTTCSKRARTRVDAMRRISAYFAHSSFFGEVLFSPRPAPLCHNVLRVWRLKGRMVGV